MLTCKRCDTFAGVTFTEQNKDTDKEKRLARLKKYQPKSTLSMLSDKNREFVLSSEAPEVSGSRDKFLLFP